MSIKTGTSITKIELAGDKDGAGLIMNVYQGELYTQFFLNQNIPVYVDLDVSDEIVVTIAHPILDNPRG